jgi:hypothetical protein
MDLARSSAARTANRFRELPLFEPAAERRALTWLFSMESSSGTGPAAAIFSKMRCQIRRWTNDCRGYRWSSAALIHPMAMVAWPWVDAEHPIRVADRAADNTANWASGGTALRRAALHASENALSMNRDRDGELPHWHFSMLSTTVRLTSSFPGSSSLGETFNFGGRPPAQGGTRERLHDGPVGQHIGRHVDFVLGAIDKRNVDVFQVFRRRVVNDRRGLGAARWRPAPPDSNEISTSADGSQ